MRFHRRSKTQKQFDRDREGLRKLAQRDPERYLRMIERGLIEGIFRADAEAALAVERAPA